MNGVDRASVSSQVVIELLSDRAYHYFRSCMFNK